ncbi:MAG TPA: transcription termination factor NusA [Candidatus Bipolaricaulota bacterium]|nr:transcription termination factor NusA [Candidatus Bipolaricaulota bacterium]
MLTEDARIAIKQICAEKNISEESVIETIESALAAAFRKDYGEKNQNIQVELNLETGKFKVFDVKEVVDDLTEEELETIENIRKEREDLREQGVKSEDMPEHEDIRRFNPKTEIELKDAKALKKTAKVGAILKTKLELPGDFGRMAAQTAKQVIIQRLREAERNVLYQQFKEKEGELLNGMVQKREGRNIVIDIDHATTIMPQEEQIRSERYKIGDRLKVYVVSVSLTTKGPEIIVSRKNDNLVKKLFKVEIPEIASDVIEIKAIAREAGSRSKVAVHTESDNIDPIGSCVGQKGARIQTIISELNGEKIDIIKYDENPAKYITNALLPAQVSSISLDEEAKIATVTVPQDQLSLTIGREGQNVRLASKLTGWKINIKEEETGKEISADAKGAEKTKKTSIDDEVGDAKEPEAEVEETPAEKEEHKK